MSDSKIAKSKIQIDLSDIIKVIAFIMVFLLHTKIFSPGNWNTKSYSWMIYTPAWAGVWIFFILSGYGTAKSFIKQKYTISLSGILKYYLSRLIKIVPLYLLYLIIVIPYYHEEIFSSGNTLIAIMKLMTFNYIADFGNLYIGNVWYLSTLIKLYLLAPFIYIIIRKLNLENNEHRRNIVAIIILLIGLLLRISYFYYGQSINVDIWSSSVYVPFYMNIDLFMVGFLSAITFKQKSNKYKKIIMFTAIMILILINCYIYYIGSYNGQSYMIYIYQYIFPTIYLFLIYILLKNDPIINVSTTFFTKSILYISRFYKSISLPLYLFHSNVLLIVSLRMQTETIWIEKPFLCTIMISVLSLLTLLLFCYPLSNLSKYVSAKIYLVLDSNRNINIEHNANRKTKKAIACKVRDSNIELLRIICMLIIIAHHCVVHGGAIYMENSLNKWIAIFLVPGGKIAFDCFLAISTWFLVDQKFKSERLIKIWLEVLFYSVAFSIFAYLLGTPFTLQNWFSIFFPIAGNSHGFAASYLMFYLLTPFLYKMTQNLNKKQAKWLLLIVFYAEVMTQIIGNISQYTQPMFSELLLFILFYLIAYYYKKWPIKIMLSKIKPFLIFVIIWLARYAIWIAYTKNPENQFISYLFAISNDESSIFNIVAGFCLFFTFKNMKVKYSNTINSIAITTFGILLIHDHNFFRYALWSKLIKVPEWYYVSDFGFRVISVSIIIFIVCSSVDTVRFHFIEKPFFQHIGLRSICLKRDDEFQITELKE